MVAGAKGAIGSTLAVAVAALQGDPALVLPSLATAKKFTFLASPQESFFSGWDVRGKGLVTVLNDHGIIPEAIWQLLESRLEKIPIIEPPSSSLSFKSQVERIAQDIQRFKDAHPHSLPVFINLLPAGYQLNGDPLQRLAQVYEGVDPRRFPDLPFVVAALVSDVPVVNFTPNMIELPAILREASERRIPIAGRDGKTGQTYVKTVLASALKARALYVDGWYSLNLLGNADGENLMTPEKAAGKLANKADLLDDILGYSVGEKYDTASHKVHIDYYPPRGDAKEAWDVIDFHGLFGLPMGLRINLQGRDSILAAPVVIDLARWVAGLKLAGRGGPVPELAFYFKKPVGQNPPITFQEQVRRLEELERQIEHD